MRSARQVLWGIITALASIALLLGVFSLSLVEGNMQQTTHTLLPTVTKPLVASPSPTLLVISPTPLISTPTLTRTPTRTSTLPPTPSNCPPPPGWLPYTTLPSDTLDGLALQVKKTSAEISQANCLGTTALLPGRLIYLPPVPTKTPTRTPVPCRIPSTWVPYTVQPGDTLYHLGQTYGISYTQLQAGNCMTGTELVAGQRLYVPPGGALTPTPTYPVIPLSTDTPFGNWTDTATPMPTETPMPTDTPVPTETPMPTDTLPTP